MKSFRTHTAWKPPVYAKHISPSQARGAGNEREKREMKHAFKQKLNQKSEMKGAVNETYRIETLIQDWRDNYRIEGVELETYLLETLEERRGLLRANIDALDSEITDLNEAIKKRT